MAEIEEGLKNRHGDIYQLKLLLLFLKKGYASKRNFYLSTEERSQAGVFDDVIFGQQEEDGKYVYHLLQAKHKSNAKKHPKKDIELIEVESGEFFTKTTKNNAFSVFKYFISYCAIRQRHSLGNIKEFILCTNADFRADQFFVTNVDSPNRRLNKNAKILYTTLMKNNGIFQNLHKIDFEKHLQMSAKYDFIGELKEAIGLDKLAQELFNCIIQNETISDKNDIFKIYEIPLFKEVLEKVNSKTARFKPDLINNDENQSTSVKMLKEKLTKLSHNYLKFSKLNLAKDIKNIPSYGNVSLTHHVKINELITRELPYNEYMIKHDEIIGIRFSSNVPDDEMDAIAEELSSSLKNDTPINLKSALKKFHLPLTKEVIDIEHSKFFDNFLKCENISEGARRLHEMLQNKVDIFSKEIKIDSKYGTTAVADPKQWTRLPNDDMLTSIIKDFCNDFVLALKQPNEKELGIQIKKEIGNLKIFQFEDATLLVEYLFTYVIEWVISKNYQPIEKEDADKLFETLNQHVCKGMIIGLNSEYCRKLRSYDIDFKKNVPTINEIEHFLKSNNQWFPIVAAHSTLLTSIQVEKAIHRSGRYSKNDSLMFLSLKSELKEEVCNAYELPDCNNLLVLVDDDNSISDEIRNSFYHKIAALMKNEMKKFILILKDKTKYEDLVTIFSTFWIHGKAFCDDNTTYANFDDKSWKAINGKPVIFQGKNMDLNKMNVSEKRNYSIIKCIPFDVLIQSDTSKPVKLGKMVEKPKNYCNYYSDRILYNPVEKENNILKLIKESNEDIFAVEGYDIDYLCQEGVEKNLISPDIKYTSNKVNILDPKNVHSEIEHLRQKHTCNVRWIKRENEKLYEIQSYSEISLIKKAIKEKFLIFADIAGMGKSTLLYHTTQKIKEIWENLWIAKIDLYKYTAKFKEAKDGEEMEIFEYMVEKDVYGKKATNYEKTLFSQMLHNGNALVMFDGFDEINPNYGELVIKLLHKLKETFSCKIWITTRIEFRHTLEKQFNTRAYFFEPFSEPRQAEFLINYWNVEFSQLETLTNEVPNAQIKTRLNKYATKIVNTFKTLDLLRWNNFLGVPLQLKMIAEICIRGNETFKSIKWHNLFDFIKSDSDIEPTLPNLTLFNLYDTFLTEKVYLHLEKRKILNFSAIDADEIATDFYQKQFQIHSIFGIKRLLNSESSNDLLNQLITPETHEQLDQWQMNHKKGKNNVGIIDYFGDEDEAHFAHLTYAEYFAAFYLVEKMIGDAALIFQVIESIIPNVSPVFEACLSSFVQNDSKKIADVARLLADSEFTKNQYFVIILEMLLGKHSWFPNENVYGSYSLKSDKYSFTMDVQNHFFNYLRLIHRNKKSAIANIEELTQVFWTCMEESEQRFSLKLDENKKIHINDNFVIDQNALFNIRNVSRIIAVVCEEFNTSHRIEFIALRAKCLKALGKILYYNRSFIKEFLPTIVEQINEYEKGYYGIESVTVNNEYIFEKGTAIGFMLPNMEIRYHDNIIILSLKVASMLDETNKCKNLADFQSLNELMTIICARHRKNRNRTEVRTPFMEDIDEKWNIIKNKLKKIEIYQNNAAFVFINSISGLLQWFKHGQDFKCLKNYYEIMNEFFSSSETTYGMALDTNAYLGIMRYCSNKDYFGALLVTHQTSKVITFYKEKKKCVFIDNNIFEM